MVRQASTRRARVFFYGLFMDADALREIGLAPEEVMLASVPGYSLEIGRRATLVQRRGGRAHGVVMSLTADELDALYAGPGLTDYGARAVRAELTDGQRVRARCYVLPNPPTPDERNPDYAAHLLAVAMKVGLPPDGIAAIREAARFEGARQ